MEATLAFVFGRRATVAVGAGALCETCAIAALQNSISAIGVTLYTHEYAIFNIRGTRILPPALGDSYRVCARKLLRLFSA